jgi:ADP-heptose:LPS heptosyltransferase
VIAGSKSESNLASEIINKVGRNIVDLTGKTTILELGGLIKGADLLISNETSAAHIGMATRTPTVCIIGGGHFDRFLPYGGIKNSPPLSLAYLKMDCYGCNWSCTEDYSGNGPVPCISRVTIKEVMKKIELLL